LQLAAHGCVKYDISDSNADTADQFRIYRYGSLYLPLVFSHQALYKIIDFRRAQGKG